MDLVYYWDTLKKIHETRTTNNPEKPDRKGAVSRFQPWKVVFIPNGKTLPVRCILSRTIIIYPFGKNATHKRNICLVRDHYYLEQGRIQTLILGGTINIVLTELAGILRNPISPMLIFPSSLLIILHIYMESLILSGVLLIKLNQVPSLIRVYPVSGQII